MEVASAGHKPGEPHPPLHPGERRQKREVTNVPGGRLRSVLSRHRSALEVLSPASESPG